MSRYIDADKIEEVIRNDMPLKYFMTSSYNVAIRNGLKIAEILNDKIPTADVKEVKHGCWIDVPLNVYNDMYKMNRYNKRTKCSVCEYVMPYEYPRFHICPNCGAQMDGGVNNG